MSSPFDRAKPLASGSIILAAVGLLLLIPHPVGAAQSSSQQAVQVGVQSQVSWGSADGCVQNIQTNDFGALTPNADSSDPGIFDATPYTASSTVADGAHVWVGCVTTNTGLASVDAHGLRDLTSSGHTLALADVDIGLTNSQDGQLNGASAGCVISPGQQTLDSCPLPTGGTEATLITGAGAGTTELNWQYQLDLPANQHVGLYTGGEVIFTATAGELETGNAPANLTRPVLSPSTAQEGTSIGATNGTWTNNPSSYTYQWQRCTTGEASCLVIASQNGSSYTPTASDTGYLLRVVVTASDAAGQTAAFSDATSQVISRSVPPTNTTPPVISPATPREGSSVSVNTGTWTGNPSDYSYQWEDCNGAGSACTPINMATSSSYTPVAGDVGHTLRVLLTATNASGSGAVDSAVSNPVLPAAPQNIVLPTVTGSASEEGVPLTASTGTWTGNPTGFSYQWQFCNTVENQCGSLAGATSATYTPTAADVGRYVRVVVSAKNASGETSASSQSTAKISGPAPVNTSLPSLSTSAPIAGVSLSVSKGSWTNTPTSYTYQWKRCDSSGENCAALSGATSSSYTPVTGDIGNTLVAEVTATNAIGSGTASTTPSGTVLPEKPQNTVLPTVTGTLQEGVALSASNGSWTGSPTSFTYQWEHCDLGENPCGPISGATGSSYAPSSVGKFIRVVVTAHNGSGETSATSRAVGRILAGIPVNTTAPVLSTSPPIAGVALSVSNGSWANSPTSYAYQWERCNAAGENCVPISGAASASYTPTAADVAKRLVAVVTASNGAGASAPAASSPSAEVQQLPSNTSVPVLSSGTPMVGTQLSVSTGSWSGYPSLFTFTYQWLRCNGSGLNCQSLAGETNATYTPVVADIGVKLEVEVTATNTAGATPILTSTTNNVLQMPPVNTSSPAIANEAPQQGLEDSVSSGTWSNSPTSYAYQWEDCNSAGESCSIVSGATSDSYTPIAGDLGHTLRVVVTASNAGGSASATSGATVVVVPQATFNTELPTVSPLSAQQGVAESATTGSWSNSPTSYAYQWEDCDSAGENCTHISGATSSSYTPVAGDVGHTLRVVVTASNAGGSASATSAPTSVVPAISHTQVIDSGKSLNAVSCVSGTTDCVASDSQGNAFYATDVSTTSNATWNAWTGPSGESPSEAVDCPTTSLCVLAAGSDHGYGGNLYYATSLGGTWSHVYSPAYGVDAISCPTASFCVDGQDGGGFYRYSTNPTSTWTLEEQGSASMNAAFCLSSTFCALVDSVGSIHVATSTSQIESSSWKETDVDGSTALTGVTCTSTTACLAVDGVGNVLGLAISGTGVATVTKHDIDGSNDLTAITCTTLSTCVTVDTQGNVFLSTNNGVSWTKQYAFSVDLTSLSCSSASRCAVVSTVGSVITFQG